MSILVILRMVLKSQEVVEQMAANIRSNLTLTTEFNYLTTWDQVEEQKKNQ